MKKIPPNPPFPKGGTNLQAEWARLLIGSLVDAGVTDAVLSPGSRSTPLVLAAVAHPGLACHDVVDERSAAYYALGRARVRGRPTLLLCTSGTAAANYLPAVVEAGLAETPLLVLTADRPIELQDCGANQTIDQLKLYGDHARRFFDLGSADPSPRALRALRRIAAQAVFATAYPRPGAVHLNARLRKPLEPGAADGEPERALTARVTELLAGAAPRPHAPEPMPAPAAVAELAEACRKTERGLIVCGPAPLEHARSRSLVAELARRTGFPVLREAASQMRFCAELEDPEIVAIDAFDALLHGERFRAAVAPELVLQVGAAPTSGVWGRYLAEHAGVAHWVLSGGGWHDPQNTARALLVAAPRHALAMLTTRLPARAPRFGTWQQLWRAASERAERAIETRLEAAGETLTEGGVARALVAALPAGSLLAVGNSLPIREVDTYGRAPGVDLRVVSQRGTSGIDGVVSAAAGAAAAQRHRAALLVGDLSFFHDLSGLQPASRVEVPFAVVVANNRGGRIFEQLPLAAHPAAGGETFEHWTTPHALDFAHAAALHDLPFERVETPAGLARALGESLERPGCTVIEAVVPPHGAVEENRALWHDLEATLETET